MVRVVDRVQEAAAELLLGSKQITLVGGLVQAGGGPCYSRHFMLQYAWRGHVSCLDAEVDWWMLRCHTVDVHNSRRAARTVAHQAVLRLVVAHGCSQHPGRLL